jgi:hypothetical protein
MRRNEVFYYRRRRYSLGRPVGIWAYKKPIVETMGYVIAK